MSRQSEMSIKRHKVKEWLKQTGFEVVIIQTQALWSWYLSGGSNRVLNCADSGASYLLTDGIKDIVLTNAIEAPRIEAEEISGLSDVTLIAAPWHSPNDLNAAAAKIIDGRRVCSDSGAFGGSPLPDSFLKLTWQLTPTEIERYRKLGAECSELTETALSSIQRGMTENDVAATLGAGMLERGIIPNLILVAADERVRRFRHPIPTPLAIDHYFMGVICAKRDGLIINLTRFGCFGTPTADLLDRFQKTALIDAKLIARTVPGKTASELFAGIQSDYADAGFPNEWTLHHQGGPTGYQGRSWIANPTCKETALENQAFAWNPSITGAKCEDTIVISDSGFELLSKPIGWEKIAVKTDVGVIHRAGLQRL